MKSQLDHCYNTTAPVWRRPDILLMLMAAGSTLAFAVWQALINNFAVERAAFTGAEDRPFSRALGRAARIGI